MKALYRKYRPRALSEVLGQPAVTKPLENALKAGKISHAYLFVGPRGTGKTSVARIFAHAVNNFDYQLEDNYVDIIEIDGASNRGIDNIRELRDSAIIAPSLGKYKVYIIDEVHMLTKDAFNALLKTLEEPPAHVIFILATTDVDKVPITITSRSQTYTFELASPDVILPHLAKICQAEGIKITDEALKIVAERGGGSFRDTLSLLDQIATLSNDEISAELIEQVLGLPKDTKIRALLETYVNLSTAEDIVKITTQMAELMSTGIKPDNLASKIIETIMKNPEPAFLPLLSKLIEVKAPFAEAKLLIALTMKFQSGQTLGAQSQSGQTLGIKNHTSAPKNHTPDTENHTSDPKNHTSDPYAQITEENEPAKKTSPSILETNPVQKTASEATKTTKSAISPAPETDSTPATDSAPAADSTPPISPAPSNFDWEAYTTQVKTLNDGLFTQIIKCKHEIIGDTLNLYPDKKIVHTILARDNNKKVLISALAALRVASPNCDIVKITVHEVGDTPVNIKKDPLLSQISGIMGGEVVDDAGGNPF